MLGFDWLWGSEVEDTPEWVVLGDRKFIEGESALCKVNLRVVFL